MNPADRESPKEQDHRKHGPVVRFRDVSVRFARRRSGEQGSIVAVDRVNLDLAPAQITSLVGPSGCGKTTLLRAIAGLQEPTEGTISIDPSADHQKGGVAFVFQQPALLPWCTTIENVMLPLRILRGNAGAKRRVDAAKRAADVLDDVGLADAHDRLPHELSGGMQMRVSIARALVTHPSVLLLDEPFAALDDMLRTQLGELVLQLWQRRRFTAVMVTHNIGEAIVLSHNIVVMRSGRCDAPIANSLPWPRSADQRRTAEFGEYYGCVSDHLRGESSAPPTMRADVDG